MILILFVADTCRECIEFFHVVLDNLKQKMFVSVLICTG